MNRLNIRRLCEHVYMLCVCFFLLWDVFYMTEAGWTFAVRTVFPAVWGVLALAALGMSRLRLGVLYLPAGLLAWMAAASAYRGLAVLRMQSESFHVGVLAFLVLTPAARVVSRERFRAWLKALLTLWTACFTLQAMIGLWAARTGHAVFSLRGTWYIGLNMGDNRLYLNAYVTTAAVKLGLSVLLTVLLAAMCRRHRTRFLCGICAAVQMACLSLTDCRTAFIALGAMLGVMLAVPLAEHPLLRSRPAWMRLGAMALTVVCLTIGVYGALTAELRTLGPHVPQVTHNLNLLELPGELLPSAGAESAESGVIHREMDADNLFNNRQHIWQAALRMLRYQPECLLHGTTSAMSYGMTNLYLDPAVEARYDHVHSIYLQTLVNWGIPGLLLLGAFLVLFLRRAWQRMRRPGPLWLRLAPAVVLYVLLCDTVDCFTRLSAMTPMLLFACLFAGLTMTAESEVAA